MTLAHARAPSQVQKLACAPSLMNRNRITTVPGPHPALTWPSHLTFRHFATWPSPGPRFLPPCNSAPTWPSPGPALTFCHFATLPLCPHLALTFHQFATWPSPGPHPALTFCHFATWPSLCPHFATLPRCHSAPTWPSVCRMEASRVIKTASTKSLLD